MPEHLLARLSLGPRVLLAVLLLIILIFALRNIPWHLDDYDQAKQAYVSYEMVQGGQWWLQHTPAGRIATKPPLVGWTSAVLAMGRVPWEIAWRLPGIAAAALLLWLLGRAGWRISRWEGATLAVAAFGLNLVAPRLTTLVRTDMVLTLFISLAGLLIYEKLRTGAAWTTTDRWQLFVALLGSMLTKGPIVYAFLLPGLAAFSWLQRRHLSRTTAWSGWWSWLGPLVFFAIWAGIGWARSPEFYDQVVRREFLGRFTMGEAAVHHNQPVFFYVLHLLRDFFPWSLALVALACVRDVRAKLRREPALLWLVCWALGGLLVMSLVPSKRGDRIFPVYTPLCLLVPALAAMLPPRLAAGPFAHPAVRAWAAIALAVGSAGGYAGYRALESFRFRDGALTRFSAQVRRLPEVARMAIVTGKDEGMLLYLHQLHFTRWEDAVALWQGGSIDLLVAPRKYAREATRTLPEAEVVLESEPAQEKFSRYLCLVRRKP